MKSARWNLWLSLDQLWAICQEHLLPQLDFLALQTLFRRLFKSRDRYRFEQWEIEKQTVEGNEVQYRFRTTSGGPA